MAGSGDGLHSGAGVVAPRPGVYPAPEPPPPGQPPPGRSAGQLRLLRRISASRRARRRRLVLSGCGILSAAVLLVSGGAWGLSGYVNSAVGRLAAGVSPVTGGSLNVLVAGVDERSGLTARQQALLHVGHVSSTNSDTMMLVHVPAGRGTVTVVSLPRDSWVELPGDGPNKLNAALGLGGPRLMVAAVERATGLTINGFIEVNFLGFVKVIDALGGVDVCLPAAVNDPYSGLRLAAGAHHVDGITALEYARDRHSFALSDLARIGNQQNLLASLLRRAISSGTLANPLRLSRFLQAIVGAVKVNRGLDVTALASQFRGISLSDVRFVTVPLASVGYRAPDGQSAVLWDRAAAARLFAGLRTGRPAARHAATRPASHSGSRGLRRSQVSADIYNGTMIGGLSAGTGAALARLGFHVRDGLTWPVQDITQTVIDYPSGQLAAARLLGQALPGARLRRAPRLARIRVVLGTAGYPVAGGSSQAGAASGTASPAAGRTAAQAACR